MPLARRRARGLYTSLFHDYFWSRMVSLVPRFRRVFKQITVEPIIFLIYLGWVFGNTLQSPGLYQKVCRLYYEGNYTVNCKNLSGNPAVEDDVQSQNARWSLYNAISYLTPAIFADTILGKM